MKEKLFDEIKIYKCKYCGKLFYTNNRHKCKYNPQYYNCFSCEYCDGINEFVKGNSLAYYSKHSGKRKETDTEKYVICKLGKEISLLYMSRNKWNLNCDTWRCMKNYRGKESYVKKVIWKIKEVQK